MTGPQISFQVRIKSTAPLADIVARVGTALGVALAPSRDRSFEPGEAFDASALGLQISVSAIVDMRDDAPTDGPQTYVVMGGLRPDLEADWESDEPVHSISNYVRSIMTALDGDGWYVPTRQELLAEAGIAGDDA